MQPLHPMPSCAMAQGFEKCPPDYRVQDPELTRVTEGNILGALMRFIGGYKTKDNTWSRSRISIMSSEGGGLELGWAHMAATNAGDVLHDIATKLPEVAAYAWGEEASKMRDRTYVKSLIDGARHTNKMPPGYEWLIAGWHQISRRGDVQDVYLRRWFDDIVAPVTSWMNAKGLKQGRTLAAGTRMRNTSGTWLGHLKKRVEELGEEAGVQKALQEYEKWKTPDMTVSRSRSGRLSYVNNTPEFQTLDIGRVSPDQVEWAEMGADPILREPDAMMVPPSGDSPGSFLPATGSGFIGKLKANWKTIGVVAIVAAGAGTAGYFLLKKKKKGKKGKRGRGRR